MYALVGTVLILPRFAVDLEIPLRAAERWMAGLPPYQADAFLTEPGATSPFLYPPYLLPLLAVLAELPREVVSVAWVGLLAFVAVAACRRLAIPWPWMPFVLAWPPFSEGIFGGNVQVVVFGAFVFLFWRTATRRPPATQGRDRPVVVGCGDRGTRDVHRGDQGVPARSRGSTCFGIDRWRRSAVSRSSA